MAPPKISMWDRFWTKCEEDENDCWIWKASVWKNGYGRITIRHGHQDYAHRVAWVLANGRVIPEDKVVMHKCDVQLCVNPEHLVLGTQSENLRDMWEKGRDWKSNGHPSPVVYTKKYQRVSGKDDINKRILDLRREGLRATGAGK